MCEYYKKLNEEKEKYECTAVEITKCWNVTVHTYLRKNGTVLVEDTLEMNIRKWQVIIKIYEHISLNVVYIHNSSVGDNPGCIFQWWPF